MLSRVDKWLATTDPSGARFKRLALRTASPFRTALRLSRWAPVVYTTSNAHRTLCERVLAELWGSGTFRAPGEVVYPSGRVCARSERS